MVQFTTTLLDGVRGFLNRDANGRGRAPRRAVTALAAPTCRCEAASPSLFQLSDRVRGEEKLALPLQERTRT